MAAGDEGPFRRAAARQPGARCLWHTAARQPGARCLWRTAARQPGARWLRLNVVLGWMLVLLPLSSCSQPNPLVTSMDNFFDSLGEPPAPTTASGVITGPGYAPAYPPFDFRSERPAPIRSTSLR